MNGTYQVLAYVDDVSLIGNDIRAVERNADLLLNACKNIDLPETWKKNKYMEVGHNQGILANE